MNYIHFKSSQNLIIILFSLIIILIAVKPFWVAYESRAYDRENEIYTISDSIQRQEAIQFHNRYCKLADHPSKTEFWVNYSGVILSAFSILFILITLINQRRELKRQQEDIGRITKFNAESLRISQNDYNAHVLRLIESFWSTEMNECRQTCWLLREEMKANPKAFPELKELFKMQIRDSWGTREEYAELQETSRFKDYAQFTKLARYFDTISHYDIDKQTAYAIHYYYVWWRGFLKLMIRCFEEANAEIMEDQRQLSFPPNWCSLVERMDQKMAGYPLE